MPRFRKPDVKQGRIASASRHLYVAGLGEGLGHTFSQVRQVFSVFGELDGVELRSEKRFVFVSFKHTSSAVLAREELKDRPLDVLGGVRLGIIEFAEELEEEDAKKSTEIEDVASTLDVAVPGCEVWTDFVSVEEEELLLNELDSHAWEMNLKRRVQHYGFTFSYSTLMLDYGRPTSPIPPHCAALSHKLSEVVVDAREVVEGGGHNTLHHPLTQLTVNEYHPGQGIASHIDTKNCFGPMIFILNLGSGITMRLQNREDTATSPAPFPHPTTTTTTTEAYLSNTGIKKFLWLPRRSLLLLRGAARYDWSHGIAARLSDKVNGTLIPRERRVSLTFRQALVPGDAPGCCIGPTAVEVDHVFRVYDNIAVHWNHTRGKRKVHWHRVKTFLEALPTGSLLADVGSGDGKYFGLNKGVTCIGCDRSWTLLQVSKEPGHEAFCCDAVKLPLVSDTFDAVICVAVLHHLASKDRRVAAIRELVRITRPGGKILIQAWAQEQAEESRHVFEEQDVLVPWRLQQRFFVPSGECPASAANSFSDGPCQHAEEDGQNGLVFQRFCHVYKKGELEDLCSHVPCCKVTESGWDTGNHFVQLEKFADHRFDQTPVPVGPSMAYPTFVKRH